jgi:uncharacterized membrane protein
MRRIWEFVKTTVLGGAMFLLPFAATLLIVVKVGKMAIDAVTPLAEKVPIPKAEAIVTIYVALGLLLMLAAFSAGLFVRSLRIESDAVSLFEDKVLNKLPPYVVLRKYSERLAGLEAKTKGNLKPVLVRIQNGWQLGFLADNPSGGYAAVFLPGAPDPSSGVVRIIDEGHIAELDVSYEDALAWLENSGRGLANLLARGSAQKRAPSADPGHAT